MESVDIFRNWFVRSKLAVVFTLLCVLSVFYYFFVLKLFQDFSTFHWLWNTWNPEADYEHAKLIPPTMVILLYFAWRKVKNLPIEPSNWGLPVILFGAMLLAFSVRTKQARVAVIAFPFLICGIAIFLWGFKISRYLYFPIFVIYFSLRFPGLEQATNSLQIVSSTIAFYIGKIFGVELTQTGNVLKSLNGKWGFDIAEGCSGIRSLMALSFIAAVYAHLTLKKMWHKIFLLASSVPIAMIANAFRIASIVLIAEYINKDFATQTYHDWSGLLFFFPIGLLILMLLAKFLTDGTKMFRRKIKRTKVVNSAV